MSLFETAIDLGEKCETAFEPFPDGSGSAHMTSKTPSSGSPTPSAIALRAALEDVGNRISFMRGVLRGDWEPLGMSFGEFMLALFADPARVQADDLWVEALAQLADAEPDAAADGET